MTKRARIALICTMVALGLWVIGASGGPASEVLGSLLVGWWRFLGRVGPRVHVHLDGVFTALFCLVFLAIGTHRFLCWFCRHIPTHGQAPICIKRSWPVRRTAALLALVMLMFVTGLAAIGITHQLGWLLRSRRPLLERKFVLPGMPTSEDDTKQLAAGGKAISSRDKQGSHKATRPVQGTPVHAWQTMILPYLPIRSDLIDFERPWNDPRNAPFFRGVVPSFLNPEIALTRNEQGFGLSHFAGNLHVLRTDRPFRLAEAKGGAANTILAGEIAGALPPWGRPGNVRDPATGFMRSDVGFRAPRGDGVNFMFLDGSVRFVKKNVDPAVLCAMRGSAGGR
ncbi:MAG TPA: H-X9-DG-CTERM domain-containing protein [Isosphaeraceae bacterium]|nr:H-X9-DG-CTERM domain-containing protein [Isosphaeraceae bacterium]